MDNINKVTRDQNEALEIYKKRREEIIGLLDPDKMTPFFMIIDAKEAEHVTIIANPETWFGFICSVLHDAYKTLYKLRDEFDKAREENPGRFNPGGN